MLTCMENTRTVVCPRSPFSSSVDSARSAADAAATGNSPPQPKPNSACAAVTKAKTACAVGPSAAVSSTPAVLAARKLDCGVRGSLPAHYIPCCLNMFRSRVEVQCTHLCKVSAAQARGVYTVTSGQLMLDQCEADKLTNKHDAGLL